MGNETNQPNWDEIAEKFDIWLPQLAPVGEALLTELDARPGDHVLDIGSGTGEPALTLARSMGSEIQITGVDAAQGMVNVAQQKVEKENLTGVHFETMPAENLTFADNSFDRVLCRFGVMLFEDPLQGLKEMYRVLRPGGRFSLAVWSTPETMLTLYWTYQAFKNKIAEEFYPPLAKVTSLGSIEVMEKMLNEAGYRNYVVNTRTFQYEFDSFDAYWDAVESSDILKMQYDALPEGERGTIRDEVACFAHEFIVDGRLAIPHDYLLVSGNK